MRLSASFRDYERPRAFVLTTEPWTIDNGMLTPAMKVKRRAVVAKYRDALDALYDVKVTADRPHFVQPPLRQVPARAGS